MHRTTISAAATLAFTLALAAATAARGEGPKQTLMPEDPETRAFQEAVGFSDAVVHGDTIYLSGVVAAPQEGETSLAPAYERAFARLDGVLKRLGARWDDVIAFDTFPAARWPPSSTRWSRSRTATSRPPSRRGPRSA